MGAKKTKMNLMGILTSIMSGMYTPSDNRMNPQMGVMTGFHLKQKPSHLKRQVL